MTTTRTLLYLTLLCSLCFFTACGGGETETSYPGDDLPPAEATKDTFAQIKPGMMADEVLNILGEPNETEVPEIPKTGQTVKLTWGENSAVLFNDNYEVKSVIYEGQTLSGTSR